jgi:hypothetical protein
MSSLRQIEANRRNARLSTGPVTEEGKKKSRRNALRHGLTAETVIHALEDAEDYVAFEMAVTADFDAQTAVERELVLRLASLLWRLRRITAIEAGLFKEQARQLRLSRERQRVIETVHQEDNERRRHGACGDGAGDHVSRPGPDDQFDSLTRAFVRLTNLPSYPLDRLNRYEASLWRQACQVLFTLRCLDRRKPWEVWARSKRRWTALKDEKE